MVSSLVGVADGDRTALVFDGGRRSFGDLNGRANRLLAGLRSLGIGAGDRSPC
ncbi:MAG: hypothetical protein ACLGIC_01265 [Acidimicrobiia bacterium]